MSPKHNVKFGSPMQYLENKVNSTALMPKRRTATEEAPGTRLRCFGRAVQNGSSDYIQSHTHRPVLTFLFSNSRFRR